MGLDFDAGVINHIHSRFGGHPFFMRQLCSAIHRMVDSNRPRRVSISNCREAETNMAATNARYIGDILYKLKEFYPAEYEMLELLASGDIATFHEAAAQGQELVEHLLGYGLIVKRGDDYEIAFELMRDEVRSLSKKSSAKDLATMREEIGRRRNRLEEELRRQLFYWARTLPNSDWKQSIVTCVSKNTTVDSSQTPQQVFSIGKSQLYFLDLMRFAIYARISLDADARSVEQDFVIVNRLRADAHAKSISAEEFSKWKEAIERLEDRYLPPD